MRTKLLAIAFFFLSSPLANAEIITVQGKGSAPITQDIALTRTESVNAAKRDAVSAAINKILGPNSTDDPAVQSKIDLIVKQIADDRIVDQSSSRDAANNFVTTLSLRLDDLEFRTLVSDQGIAATTARNFPILIVMDEFFTTPSDKTKPLRDLVEYNSDKSASSTDAKFTASSASSYGASTEKMRSAEKSDATINASAAERANATVPNGASMNGARSASVSGKSSYASAGARDANSVRDNKQSSIEQSAAASEQKDIQMFRHLVEYQPQNVGPDRQNLTLNALTEQTGRYDLAVMDSDLFKSKYFRGKPLTMDEMLNSGALEGFSRAARDEKADYLLVGNSIIYDNGKSTVTGQSTCDGVVSLKVYATEDAAAIAGNTRTESASGNGPDQCRANVAVKLGTFAASTVSSAIHDYWKKREAYGREYRVKLVSLLGSLHDDVKDDFAEAIESYKRAAKQSH